MVLWSQKCSQSSESLKLLICHIILSYHWALSTISAIPCLNFMNYICHLAISMNFHSFWQTWKFRMVRPFPQPNQRQYTNLAVWCGEEFFEIFESIKQPLDKYRPTSMEKIGISWSSFQLTPRTTSSTSDRHFQSQGTI